MRNKSALLAGILAGLASPGTMMAETKYPRLSGNDMTRLRGDVARVGGDFATVINREHGKIKNDQSS